MNEDLLNRIATDVGQMRGRLESCCEQLEKHHHEIYGNGQPGLKSRLYYNERVASQAAKGRKAYWSSVASFLSFVGTLVAGWFQTK